MVRKIIFDNEITLWWEYSALPECGYFEVFVNGETVGKTTKTHYEIHGLTPLTNYVIKIVKVDAENNPIEKLCDFTVQTAQAKKRIDVTKPPYFAIGDGVNNNTVAIQSALNDCKPNEVVYFPKGTYLTGALNVRSNTEIYIEVGAVLQGSVNLEDYLPKRKSRFEGVENNCYGSLINIGELDKNGGFVCENIIIRGGGIISGGGESLCKTIIDFERKNLRDYLIENADYVKSCENPDTIPGRTRGRLISVFNSKNVVLSGITVQYGPAWNVHAVYSKNVTVCGCKIISQGVWNGDGFDPDSSEDCAIFDTEFYTHDDSVAIKSGKNPEGNIINRPAKNIYVFDCRGRNGISIGSEISGGIDGVYVWDCDFSVSYGGMTIKTTKKRGGYIRNIFVNNCTFNTFTVYSDLPYNNDGESAGTLTKIENIKLENVTLNGLRTYADGTKEKLNCIELYGFDDKEFYLNNVTLKNLTLNSYPDRQEQTLKIKNVKNLSVENVNYK